MTHEKIFERPGGYRIKVVATFYIYFDAVTLEDTPVWSVRSYLSLPGEDIFPFDYNNESASKEEVFATKMELWKQMKPTL